jgi:hypothetical protein
MFNCSINASSLNGQATKVAVSGTKPYYGHPLGASAAIEGVLCALAIRDGLIPPTLNYRTLDPDCDLDVVPNEPREISKDLWAIRLGAPVTDSQSLQKLGVNHPANRQAIRSLERSNRLAAAGANHPVNRTAVIAAPGKFRLH